MHSVNFNFTGEKLAWVGHNSTISVSDASKGMAVSVVQTDLLPFLTCLWLSEKVIVAAVSFTIQVYFKFLLDNLELFCFTRVMDAVRWLLP